MGSKWLTLAFVGSLGLMAWLCPAKGEVARAGDEDGSNVWPINAEERRRALELMRQATTELQANHLDAARRLAMQAAKLHATYSLFDVRPEHVLAEIERKERSGGEVAGPPAAPSPQPAPAPAQPAKAANTLVHTAAEPADPFDSSKPAAQAAPPRTSAPPMPNLQAAQPAASEQPKTPPTENAASPDALKARAIEMLDHGLLALDEHRLDDAERYAREAQSLHASFGTLEYKPEYLITEIGIARARMRLDAAMSPPAPAPKRQPAPAVAQTQFAQQAPVAVPRTVSPVPAAAAPPAAVATSAQPSVQSPAGGQGAASSHDRAERMLQEALRDLRAGHDEVARARIEGALGVIHTGTPRTPLLPAGSSIAASPQPAPRAEMPQPVPRAEMPQLGMPRAGFPAYAPPDRTLDERDVALKPLHDPYLGDEPASTAKSTPAENSMRETMPSFSPMSSSLSLNHPLPRMNDELHQQPVATSYPANGAAATHTQAVADSEAQPAKVRWPESQPAPSSQSRTVAPAPVAPAVAPAPAASAPTAPAAQPGAYSPYSSQNHYSYNPQNTDPWHNSTSADEHPGYFRRLWNALNGN